MARLSRRMPHPGREHRYGDAQLRFHYINDTEPLRRECLDRDNEGERY